MEEIAEEMVKVDIYVAASIAFLEQHAMTVFTTNQQLGTVTLDLIARKIFKHITLQCYTFNIS